MKKALILLSLSVILITLVACGIQYDTEAADIAEKVNYVSSKSKLFPSLLDLNEIYSPVCVIVKDSKGSYFLEADDLPATTRPDEACSILIVELFDSSSVYFNISLTNSNGDYFIRLSHNIDLKNREGIADALNTRFTFIDGTAGADTLIDRIQAYEESLFSRDYLSPITKSENSYDDNQNINNIRPEQVCNPLVYLLDEDFTGSPLSGSDLYASPAENNQYTPPNSTYEDYIRPEISGKISLAFSSIEVAKDSPDAALICTLSTIETMLDNWDDTFCFFEIVGVDYYGSTGEGASVYSYLMRASIITMDGELLWWGILSYSDNRPDYDESLRIGITTSIDEYDRFVFPWDYKSALWKAVVYEN